jgi:hypothetical protein
VVKSGRFSIINVTCGQDVAFSTGKTAFFNRLKTVFSRFVGNGEWEYGESGPKKWEGYL